MGETLTDFRSQYFAFLKKKYRVQQYTLIKRHVLDCFSIGKVLASQISERFSHSYSLFVCGAYSTVIYAISVCSALFHLIKLDGSIRSQYQCLLFRRRAAPAIGEAPYVMVMSISLVTPTKTSCGPIPTNDISK